MGFGSYIDGILLCVLAVLLAFLGFAVLLGLLTFVPTNFNIPLGIGMIIVALLVFAYMDGIHTSRQSHEER